MKSKNQTFWDDAYVGGKDYSDLTQEQIEIIFKGTDADSSILDIGAGTGKLMKVAEENGLRVAGIELSEVAITKAKERGVTGEIVHLDTEEIDGYVDESKYHKIILKLVIAFIKNKINLLSWIKDHLNHNGELIIITPTIGKDNEFKMPGIAINKNELERSLNLIFGNYKIRNEMDTPNGKIYTYVCVVE